MQVNDLTVEVRDRTLKRVGQVTPHFLNLKARTRWSAVGEWSLNLPGGHAMVPYLAEPGSGIILLGPDGTSNNVILSGPTRTPARVRNQQNPDGTYTFSGVTDEVILQGARAFPNPLIADPQASSQSRERDVRTGATEDILRQYVAYNIASTHAPAGRIRGFRNYTRLGGGTLNRGLTQTKSPRFQNLLELLQEVVAYDPSLGFRMVQVGANIEFQVLDARDRTKFIRFDIENGTITSEEVQFGGPVVTDAFAAGQGEGTARTIVRRQTPESIAAETEWGLVWEEFIDQRNTDDLAELQQSGDEALLEGSGGTAVKMVPADDTTMRVGLDWRLGDAVTTVVSGQETAARVTEVAYVAGPTGVMAGAALGDVSGFNQQDAESSQVKTLDSRVSALERSGGLLPQRLAVTGRQVTDWNQATEPGWYWSDAGATNAPNAGAFVGEVKVSGGAFAGRLVQEASLPSMTLQDMRRTWRRVRQENGTWSAWVPVTGPRHAEFAASFTLATGGTGPTAIPAMTRDTAYSRQGEFATPIAGGFSCPAGLYQVSLAVYINGGTNLVRYFAQVGDNVSGRARRVLTGTSDDQFAGSVTVYLPSPGNINVSQYQNSGAARAIDMRVEITELE